MSPMPISNELNDTLGELDVIRLQVRQALVQVRTVRCYDLLSTRRVGVGADQPLARIVELSEGWAIVHWRKGGQGVGLFPTMNALREALVTGKERMLSLVDASERGSDAMLPERFNAATSLTPREYQALIELSHGLSDKEIGQKMGIRHTSVKSILCRGYNKLGVASRLQAALLMRDKVGPG